MVKVKGVHCCPRAQRWTGPGRSAFLLTQTGVLTKVLPAIVGSPSSLPFPYPGLLLFQASILKSLLDDENEPTAQGVAPGPPTLCHFSFSCVNPGPPRELNCLSSPHPSYGALITLLGAHTGNSHDYSQQARGGCCNIW